MTWIVIITIFLGLLMIFFFKPHYDAEQIGAASLEDEALSSDFGELFDEFQQPEDIDANFINEET